MGRGAFCAQYYPYSDRMCTYVMECDAAAWDAADFADLPEQARQLFCEDLFADDLNGGKLISNNANWRNFQPIQNRAWVHGHRVLIGDAVRRAHFSIGSGTRIAMEDSIALVEALVTARDTPTALDLYVQQRQPQADKLLSAARESYLWYEGMAGHMQGKTPAAFAFAFDYLTRTSNVDAARVEAEFPAFMAALSAEKVAS